MRSSAMPPINARAGSFLFLGEGVEKAEGGAIVHESFFAKEDS